MGMPLKSLTSTRDPRRKVRAFYSCVDGRPNEKARPKPGFLCAEPNSELRVSAQHPQVRQGVPLGAILHGFKGLPSLILLTLLQIGQTKADLCLIGVRHIALIDTRLDGLDGFIGLAIAQICLAESH